MGGVPQWIIKQVNKPNFEAGEAQHKYLNHTFKYPGVVTWQDVNVTLVDPVEPDAAQTMVNIFRNSGYNLPGDPQDTTTMSKARAVAALGRITIQQLGPEAGEIVEQWRLVNAWIKSVNFGDLNYESEELTNIELTLSYDFAVLEIPGEIGGVRPANE
jgi:hypothetical protein